MFTPRNLPKKVMKSAASHTIPDDSWKSLLYRYLQAHNEMEVDYSLSSLLPVVSDAAYLDKQAARLRRMKECRGNTPYHKTQSETKVKISHVIRQDGDVVVYTELNKQHSYRNGMIERRVEREKLTFAPVSMQGRTSDAQWQLTRVEADESERNDGELDIFDTVGGLDSLWMNGEGVRIEERSSHSVGVFLNEQIFSPHAPLTRAIRYNRAKAVKYADRYWNESNPQYLTFDVNCTNYVSQCLFAGDAPMNYTGRRETGWWYRGKSQHQELWSYSWAVSHSLQTYLLHSKAGLRGERVDDPRQLELGDLIFYDWDGTGRFGHSVIVTAFGKDNYPLVNANTVSSYHRYWDYRDSYAWTENTRYLFVHIIDS